MSAFKPFFVVLAVCLFGGITAFSQRELIYTFDTSLHFNPHSASYLFAHLKVVDNRYNKADIGQVKTGGFNRKGALVTDKPLDQAISEFYDNISIYNRKGKDTLLLTVEDFRIEDRPNGDEIGTFYFRGRFFIGAGGGKYIYLKEVDTIYEVRSGWDVTGKILAGASLKMFEWLTDIGAPKLASRDDLMSPSDAAGMEAREKMQYSIYAAGGNFKKGVYASYEDFLDHKVIDTPFVQQNHFVDNKVNRPYFYYANKRGKKGQRIDSVFAIYNGQSWYQPHKGGWTRLRYENGDFHKKENYRGLAGSQNSAAAMGAMFGLAGVAIAAIAVAADDNSSGTVLGVYDCRLNPVKRKYYPVKRVY